MEEFKNYWPTLIKNISHKNNNYSDIHKSIGWLVQVLDQNVPFGKQTRYYMKLKLRTYYPYVDYNLPNFRPSRAKLFLETFHRLKPNATIKERETAYVVGWCIEIMQAAYLIADDVMDGSKTRRSRPCWYLQVGTVALNDVLLLENLVYELFQETMLKTDKGKLLDLILLFQRTSYRTILGQSLDTKLGLEKDIDGFNYRTYGAIVKYKTSIYTFYQPVAAAMILAEEDDIHKILCTIEHLACKIGYLFQVQDDFIDCFGDPKITGKIGTDIQEGKCTWLAVKALQIMDDKQLKIFKENYGLSNEENAQTIKNLYNQLNLLQVYKKFEGNLFNKLTKVIRTQSNSVVEKVFACILEKIYKRTH